MKSCYIVAAAELAPERLRPEPGDMLIAADAGLLHLERLGLAPDLALGDFDSLGYVPEAPQVEVCPVRKDDTDTMAALRRALELGYRRALIFGGLGGRRFDHSLANVQALAWADAHGMEAWLIGRSCALTALSDGAELRFDARYRGDFSAFCLGGLRPGGRGAHAGFPPCGQQQLHGRAREHKRDARAAHSLLAGRPGAPPARAQVH